MSDSKSFGGNKRDNYISVREAAEKMGYTRQYVYRSLNNRFKDYVKIINGEKKLHVKVLDTVKRVNVDSKVDSKYVNSDSKQNEYAEKTKLCCPENSTDKSNCVNKKEIDVTNEPVNITQLDAKMRDSNLVNIDSKVDSNQLDFGLHGYNEDLIRDVITMLKQQIAEKDKQLSEKDKQLSERDNQLLNLQKELNLQNEHVRKQSDRLVGLVEQVNELQRNNQVLLAQKDMAKKELETKKQKKGIFSWMSKKQSNDEDN